jgi:hypothetical protein
MAEQSVSLEVGEFLGGEVGKVQEVFDFCVNTCWCIEKLIGKVGDLCAPDSFTSDGIKFVPVDITEREGGGVACNIADEFHAFNSKKTKNGLDPRDVRLDVISVGNILEKDCTSTAIVNQLKDLYPDVYGETEGLSATICYALGKLRDMKPRGFSFKSKQMGKQKRYTYTFNKVKKLREKN